VFGGYDVNAGVATPLVVPRVNGNQQGVVVNGDKTGPFSSSLSPAPTGADTLGMLLDATRLDILASANPSAAQQALTAGESAASALENPSVHDSTTADCASCHLAESARVFGDQFAATHGLDAAGTSTQTFTAAQTLRACGYVGTTPVLSQRTINESALAAERMGALLP
jgi:cytochrome c553